MTRSQQAEEQSRLQLKENQTFLTSLNEKLVTLKRQLVEQKNESKRKEQEIHALRAVNRKLQAEYIEQAKKRDIVVKPTQLPTQLPPTATSTTQELPKEEQQHSDHPTTLDTSNSSTMQQAQPQQAQQPIDTQAAEEISKLKKEVELLKSLMNKSDDESKGITPVNRLFSELKVAHELLEANEKEIELLKNQKGDLEAQLALDSQSPQPNVKKLEKMEEHIRRVESELIDKEYHIETLNEKLTALEDELKSSSAHIQTLNDKLKVHMTTIVCLPIIIRPKRKN